MNVGSFLVKFFVVSITFRKPMKSVADWKHIQGLTQQLPSLGRLPSAVQPQAAMWNNRLVALDIGPELRAVLYG